MSTSVFRVHLPIIYTPLYVMCRRDVVALPHPTLNNAVFDLAILPTSPLRMGMKIHLHLVVCPQNLFCTPLPPTHVPDISVPLEFKGWIAGKQPGNHAAGIVEYVMKNEDQKAPASRVFIRIHSSPVEMPLPDLGTLVTQPSPATVAQPVLSLTLPTAGTSPSSPLPAIKAPEIPPTLSGSTSQLQRPGPVQSCTPRKPRKPRKKTVSRAPTLLTVSEPVTLFSSRVEPELAMQGSHNTRPSLASPPCLVPGRHLPASGRDQGSGLEVDEANSRNASTLHVHQAPSTRAKALPKRRLEESSAPKTYRSARKPYQIWERFGGARR